MVRKQIQKHDFLNGGPERQYSLNFNSEGQDTINIGLGGITNMPQINPQFSIVNNNGDNIFMVTENEIRWNGQNVMTEERINEIVETRIRELGLI